MEQIEEYLRSTDYDTILLGYELLKAQKISHEKKNAIMHKCNFATHNRWSNINRTWWYTTNMYTYDEVLYLITWAAPLNWEI